MNGLTLSDDAGCIHPFDVESALTVGQGSISIKVNGKTAVLTHKLDGVDTCVTSHDPVRDVDL